MLTPGAFIRVKIRYCEIHEIKNPSEMYKVVELMSWSTGNRVGKNHLLSVLSFYLAGRLKL